MGFAEKWAERKSDFLLPDNTKELSPSHSVSMVQPDESDAPCDKRPCLHDRGGWCLYLEWKGAGERMRLEYALELCPMVYLDLPPIPSAPITPEKPPETRTNCRSCGGADFWRSIHDRWICRICHPPASSELVKGEQSA